MCLIYIMLYHMWRGLPYVPSTTYIYIFMSILCSAGWFLKYTSVPIQLPFNCLKLTKRLNFRRPWGKSPRAYLLGLWSWGFWLGWSCYFWKWLYLLPPQQLVSPVLVFLMQSCLLQNKLWLPGQIQHRRSLNRRGPPILNTGMGWHQPTQSNGLRRQLTK